MSAKPEVELIFTIAPLENIALMSHISTIYKSSSGDEIPERDVTWRIILYSYDYLFTTELRHTCTSGIFSK